jgi:hypothetical protein
MCKPNEVRWQTCTCQTLQCDYKSPHWTMIWLISFNPLETDVYITNKENENLLSTTNLYFCNCLCGIILSHAIYWLALLLLIQDVAVLFCGPKVCCPEWKKFGWLFRLSKQSLSASYTTVISLHILPNSSFTVILPLFGVGPAVEEVVLNG